MSNGAFGENFPYSNFHDLNMDWIIKIAKDFLDQYTHIQEVIANGEESLQTITAEGLQSLQDKATALEALLQQWYNEHSEDIAEELASAISEFSTEAQSIVDQVVQSIPSDYSNLSTYAMQVYPALGNNDNLPSLNTVDTNGIRTFVPTQSWQPTGCPDDVVLNQYYTLITNMGSSTMAGGSLQILYDSMFNIWIRYKTGNGWDNWRTLTTYLIEVYPALGNSTNLPDLNTVPDNTVRTFIPSSSWKPLHIPDDMPLNEYDTLITMMGGSSMSGGSIQILMDTDNNIRYRHKQNANNWFKWFNPANTVYTVAKDGTGDYASFTQAVRYFRNKNKKNITIYVKEGNYDLISEMTAIFPNYFNNYNPNDSALFPDARGLCLGGNMTIICSPNAIFTAHYEGSNETVMQSYSPIWMSNESCTIIGMTLSASRVRYALHDDPFNPDDTDSEYKKPFYHHYYKQCNITLDNTQSARTFKACIGGGFGKQCIITIEDCIFNSVGAPTTEAIVNYHNALFADQLSNASITGCYFKTGTCGLTWYGSSTKVSTMICANNRLKSAPVHRAEASSVFDVHNTELLAWNNLIE